MATEQVNFKDFDWDSITSDDAVGSTWPNQIYVLKGFRKDSNNYRRILITIPKVIYSTIAEAVLDNVK